jgi:cbb3-type cytochrome oxidase maturation protein
MNILIILIPVSLILAALGLAAFLWTLRSNQYDDLDGDAWRILVEDDVISVPEPATKAPSDAG